VQGSPHPQAALGRPIPESIYNSAFSATDQMRIAHRSKNRQPLGLKVPLLVQVLAAKGIE